MGNGRWETAKFNNRMQVTELGLGNSATDASVWKTVYEYGDLQTNGTVDTAKNTGNIAKQTLTFSGLTQPIVQAYKYDSLYRLTEAKETANSTQNWIQNWEYDRYGNRTGFSQNVAGITTAPNPAIDADTNRFNTGQGFSYDKNGNIVSDVDPVTSQSRTFVFNGDNKQIQVKDVNNNVIGQYYYDGEGKRIKKVINATGETNVFVYSSSKLVAEYSTTVESVANAKVAYTTTDHLGTPRIITNHFGQVSSRRDFRPFGEEITINVGARTASLNYGNSDDKVRQKFTGYQKDDETSLDFAEARMYENRFGRFTAVDPLLASGKSVNPQTFNRYAYTSNNPIDRVDLDGKDWVRVKETRVTYGRTYTIWVPVWKDNAAGSERWEKGVYRIGGGKDRGKWAALDPWNNRWTLADTRAGAMAASENYRKQAIVNAAAGLTQLITDTINLIDILTNQGRISDTVRPKVGTAIRDSIAHGATGAPVDESSGPFTSANNLSSALAAAGSGLGVGQTAVRIAAGPVQRTVLGKSPTYLREAERLGANALDIRKEIWDSMTRPEQWRMNTKFLDEAINRGDDFILATDPAKATGFYLDELLYLKDRGYKPSDDGTRLVRPR